MYQSVKLNAVKSTNYTNHRLLDFGLGRKGGYIILYLYNIIYIHLPHFQIQNS